MKNRRNILFATLLSLGMGTLLPGQEEPPPRPALPGAAPPRLAPEKQSRLRRLLGLLGRIREKESAARRARQAFLREKEALRQETAALERRLEAMKREAARLEGEKESAGTRLERERQRAAAARQELEVCAGEVHRFSARVEELFPRREGKEDPAGADPLALPAEVGRLWRQLADRAGLLRSVEARRRTLDVAGRRRAVLELRLGGVALLWRTLDGSLSGWRTADGRAVPLPPELVDLDDQIELALAVIERRRSPAFTTLPLPRVEGGDKR